MAKKKNKQKDINKKVTSLNNQNLLTVISVDKMGRVITSGGAGFTYGVLLPQNILVNSTHLPIENAISLITSRLSAGNKINARVSQILKSNKGVLVALLTLNFTATKDLLSSLEELVEGNIYDVTVDEILYDYIKLQIKDSEVVGYIEKKAFETKQVNVGDSLRLRLDHKGENSFQYVHFINVDDSKNLKAVDCVELTEEETQTIYNSLFSETERNLLPEEGVGFVKKLISRYSKLNRKDSFLEDLNCIYCRYDSKLEIVISSFNKYNSTYLTDSSYWLKYQEIEELGKEYLLLFNSDDVVILIEFVDNSFVIKELYYSRTNQAAKELLEHNKDACLKLDAGKLHILNKYQSTPYGFSSNEVLDYISDMQSFHNKLLKELKSNLIFFRENNAREFDILKEVIEFERDNEIKKIGEIVYIKKIQTLKEHHHPYIGPELLFILTYLHLIIVLKFPTL